MGEGGIQNPGVRSQNPEGRARELSIRADDCESASIPPGLHSDFWILTPDFSPPKTDLEQILPVD